MRNKKQKLENSYFKSIFFSFSRTSKINKKKYSNNNNNIISILLPFRFQIKFKKTKERRENRAQFLLYFRKRLYEKQAPNPNKARS